MLICPRFAFCDCGAHLLLSTKVSQKYLVAKIIFHKKKSVSFAFDFSLDIYHIDNMNLYCLTCGIVTKEYEDIYFR